MGSSYAANLSQSRIRTIVRTIRFPFCSESSEQAVSAEHPNLNAQKNEEIYLYMDQFVNQFYALRFKRNIHWGHMFDSLYHIRFVH